jgi:DNA-damage-inducible protein D
LGGEEAKAVAAGEVVSDEDFREQLETLNEEDFALFRSKGDQALFGGTTQAMKAQWKVPDNRPLADFAPTIILKVKDFATEITIFNAAARDLEATIAGNVTENLEA